MQPTLPAQYKGVKATDLIYYLRMNETSTPVSRPATGRAGQRVLTPADFAYAEVGKLDPEGRGGASYEIVPGVITRLSARVRRLTAPNPGYMTGPGTNAYLVGAGPDFAIIDPGPADAGHIQAI